jgi:hypothetical protein
VGSDALYGLGEEMILVKVIEDVTMPVSGFQRHAYMCSTCNETEQRLVFNKSGEERGTEAAPEFAAVAITSISQGLLQTAKRVVRLLRAK